MKVILASASPRRRQLLSPLVPDHETLVPDVDEDPLPGESPDDFPLRVAEDKMKHILASLEPAEEPRLIITSDTIVTIDDLILGKPKDYRDAVEKISLLNGRTHRVVTGLSLCVQDEKHRSHEQIITGKEATAVTFKKLDLQGLEAYLASIHYMDKAGAYAFQENGRMIVDHVEGSVTNVIGFPLRLFYRMLGEMGLTERVLR